MSVPQKIQHDHKMWFFLTLCFCVGLLAALGIGGYGFYKSLQLRDVVSDNLKPGECGLFPRFRLYCTS